MGLENWRIKAVTKMNTRVPYLRWTFQNLWIFCSMYHTSFTPHLKMQHEIFKRGVDGFYINESVLEN